MAQHKPPPRSQRPPQGRSSITSLARTYHACALALSQTLGLPLAEVLAAYRESVSALFIEANRRDLHVPAGVALPPVADRPATAAPGKSPTVGDVAGPPEGEIQCTGLPPDPEAPAPEATKLSLDMARQLKQLAHLAFGYPQGDQRLRHDLGFEPDESLRLRHLCKHVSPTQARPLLEAYTATARAMGNGHAQDE